MGNTISSCGFGCGATRISRVAQWKGRGRPHPTCRGVSSALASRTRACTTLGTRKHTCRGPHGTNEADKSL